MIGVEAILMFFLELTLVMVTLCLLLRLRNSVGTSSFTILIGALIIFGEFMMAGRVGLKSGNIHGIELLMPLQWVVLRPCLAVILLVYITDGVLAAQRIIVGVLISLGLFFYLCKLTQFQENNLPYPLSFFGPSAELNNILEAFSALAISEILLLLLAMLFMPVFYSILKKLRLPIYLRLCGSMLPFVLFTWMVASWLSFSPDSTGKISGLIMVYITVMCYLSLIMWLYLTRVEKEPEYDNPNGPWELLFAFFCGYGKSLFLQKNLLDWENRHKMVMQNATDMIMLFDDQGIIHDANIAALRILGYENVTDLIREVNFFTLSGLKGGMFSALDKENFRGDRRRLDIVLKDGSILNLDAAFSRITLKNSPLIMMVGRDVSEETKIMKDKNDLAEQVVHLQRLEALGKLTGGIAHDFNNYIHAILGHLDLIEMKYDLKNPELIAHLHKIGDVAEQAGRLTGQLLGFARKGKYMVVELDLRELGERALELFLPKNRGEVEISCKMGDESLLVNGDKVQLQQVMLNLLLNAVDALKDNPPERPPMLTVMAGKALESPVLPEPPRPIGGSQQSINFADYYFIMVRDNGKGMDKETLEQVFDPFFTTKPVGEGTGMGLPMVYGAITNHYGWVQVKSKLDSGTAVLLFFPASYVKNPIPIQAEVEL